MTVFILKIIAIVTMVLDHVASAFFNSNMVMRTIGRLAFPIYAFLIAEGYYHIKNNPEKVKKHFIRLFVLTVVSEPIYDLFEEGSFFYWDSQSVMPVLLLGMMGLMIIERFRDQPVFIGVFCAISAGFTYFAKTNYKLTGVLMIIFFYWFVSCCREWPVWKKYAVLMVFAKAYLILYNWSRYGFPAWGRLIEMVRSRSYSWSLIYIVIMLIFALYNGRNGYKNRILNTVYAWFYPAHLLLLALIGFALGNYSAP